MARDHQKLAPEFERSLEALSIPGTLLDPHLVNNSDKTQEQILMESMKFTASLALLYSHINAMEYVN